MVQGKSMKGSPMITLGLGLLAGYTLLVILAWWFQDSFIYFPVRRLNTSPLDYGYSYREVEIPVNQQVRLHGWLIGDEDAPNLIVYFHGNAGHIGHRLPLLPALPLDLTAVLLFDYRGYGRSSGKPSEKGLYEDGRSVLLWCKNHMGDSINVFLLGESLGGAIAARMAREFPARGLILVSAFPSLMDVARHHYWYLPVRPLLRSQFPTIADLKQSVQPVLIFHGQKDRIVPLHMAQQIKAVLGTRAELVTLDAGHNDLLWVHQDSIREKIRQFITKSTDDVL